jgi:EAL domain-containing protein (putative c-di-GMP-specific phosphodiesterase class I)
MADLADTIGVSPGRIVFEMGEDVLAGSGLGILETLSALREVGFVLAIDDFGVGYSSLNRMKEYSIDILKVAKPLVDSIDEMTDGIPLAGAAVSFARSLGKRVVAQGVEKRGQLELLRSFGCDMWQGRYFSMPVGSRKARALLARSLDPRS